MPTHKTPLSPLSLNQLSEITGRTYRTIKKRLQSLDPEDEDGKTLLYNTIDALELIYTGSDADSSGDEEGGGQSGKPKINVQYEYARLTKAKADKLELEVQEKRNELVPIQEAERMFSDIVLAWRNQIRALPAKTAPLLIGKEQIREVEAILKNSIDETLTELASYEVKNLGDDDVGGDEGITSAEADNL